VRHCDLELNERNVKINPTIKPLTERQAWNALAAHHRSVRELQQQLAAADLAIPIIFITGYGDIPMSVQAMKAGAVEFLTKPFREQDLLDAVQQALARDRTAREQRAKSEDLRRRYRALTPRERDVLARVVTGRLNKQIAGELGTSEAAVKVHRQHVMAKMGAGSLAELVRMADRLGIPTPQV
jgi:FixJ family two-component response regulator